MDLRDQSTKAPTITSNTINKPKTAMIMYSGRLLLFAESTICGGGGQPGGGGAVGLGSASGWSGGQDTNDSIEVDDIMVLPLWSIVASACCGDSSYY